MEDLVDIFELHYVDLCNRVLRALALLVMEENVPNHTLALFAVHGISYIDPYPSS